MASIKRSPSEGANAGAFKCDQPGCQKTFTRKDHLIRHQANHSSTTYTCSICNRAFKRLDLLQRHEKRNICGGPGPSRRSSKRARTDSSPEPSPLHVDGSVQPYSFFDGWSPDLLGFEDWLPKQTDSLAGPYNETLPMLDLPWNVLMVTKESAARAEELVVSAALIEKLKSSYPDYDFSSATEYMQLYWSQIAPSYPFIHRGTFEAESAPVSLVMMMLIAGSTRSALRQDFGSAVSAIRSEVIDRFGTAAPISAYQTLTLCHVHDTWYGSQESLFMTQCMWSMVITHSRRTGIGQQGGHPGDGEEQAWASWAKGEERRRAGYAVLMIDTQISAFWNQHSSRQLSVFAHDLPLPCPSSQWEALSAPDWLRAKVSTPAAPTPKRQAFMPGLHPEFQPSAISDGFSPAILSALISRPEAHIAIDLDNSMSIQMILLGIMATAWDQRIKGGMGIRLKEGTKHWRRLTQDALIHLRATWEEAIQHTAGSVEIRDLRDTFGISILSVLSDVPMLLAVAGASTVCGTSLLSKHYEDARKRCQIWTKTDDAFTCLWQSARYLKQALFADWGMYTPWAVFLTTLVLYAYASSTAPIPNAFSRPSSTPAVTTNILLDSILASNARPILANEPILDLLQCVAEKLASKEQIDRGNADLLRNLISNGSKAEANGHYSAMPTPIMSNGDLGSTGINGFGGFATAASALRNSSNVRGLEGVGLQDSLVSVRSAASL